MHGSRKATKPHEMTIRRAASGGYIVRHAFNNENAGPSYAPSKEHIVRGGKELLAHVTEHMCGPYDEGGEEPATPDQKRVPTKAQGRAAARMRGAGVD